MTTPIQVFGKDHLTIPPIQDVWVCHPLVEIFYSVKVEIDKQLVKVNKKLLGQVCVKLGRIKQTDVLFKHSGDDSCFNNPLSTIQVEADAKDVFQAKNAFCEIFNEDSNPRFHFRFVPAAKIS